jgi:hypothetical protein
MTNDPADSVVGVAETRSRFSELIERVRHGERFLVGALLVLPFEERAAEV